MADDLDKKKEVKKQEEITGQLSMFGMLDNSPVVAELRNADLSAMTPIDALNFLYKLQKELE